MGVGEWVCKCVFAKRIMNEEGMSCQQSCAHSNDSNPPSIWEMTRILGEVLESALDSPRSRRFKGLGAAFDGRDRSTRWRIEMDYYIIQQMDIKFYGQF